MRKQNKVVKLTEKDVKYIIRAKTKNDSIKNIAHDMKLSKSTVKKVWMHWIKHQEPIAIKKFGRKKKEPDKESEKLVIKDVRIKSVLQIYIKYYCHIQFHSHRFYYYF